MTDGLCLRKTKQIHVGGVLVGGGADISIQSMLCARWDDIPGNVSQAVELESAGCEILRVAVPNRESVSLIPAIKEKISIPLVADIHFDYQLALESAAAGIDKIRINPGNIGGKDKVKQVADICRIKRIPIRIGVNAGSLEKEILLKHGGHPTPQAMVESALYHAGLLEEFDFTDIIISLKSSDVKTTVDAYRLMAGKCGYPLHLGVTEAGTSRMGLIRSAMGIGGLLLDGIGDTIRVTLTAPPVEEIAAAKDILKAAGIRKDAVRFISCPTCGRTSIDIFALAKQAEEALRDCTLPITVAVMGCAVNGPGEAREADIAICGGEDCAALYVKGKAVARINPDEIIPALLREVENLESVFINEGRRE